MLLDTMKTRRAPLERKYQGQRNYKHGAPPEHLPQPFTKRTFRQSRLGYYLKKERCDEPLHRNKWLRSCD